MIGVVVVGALLIVIGFIMLGNQQPRGATSPTNVSQFPALGAENAPVTMVEYSDYG
jgi:protein-disulfide isomerase